MKNEQLLVLIVFIVAASTSNKILPFLAKNVWLYIKINPFH